MRVGYLAHDVGGALWRKSQYTTTFTAGDGQLDFLLQLGREDQCMQGPLFAQMPGQDVPFESLPRELAEQYRVGRLCGVVGQCFQNGRQLVNRHALGQKVLQQISKASGAAFNVVKQDLGLTIAILLVERFGADGVETLRNENSGCNSTRSPGRAWPTLYWVSRYTPHRLTDIGRTRLGDGRGDK